MKFKINQLGPIQTAEIELGKLTVICGLNNTGKSYLSYSVYSFLHELAKIIELNIFANCFEKLFKEGSSQIDMKTIWPAKFNHSLYEACQSFQSFVPWALAVPSPSIKPDMSFDAIALMEDYERFLNKKMKKKFQLTEQCFITEEKEAGSSIIKFTLENTSQRLPNKRTLEAIFGSISSYFITKHCEMIPDVFSISSERTGVFLFAEEFFVVMQSIFEKRGKKKTQGIVIEEAENEGDINDKKPLPYQKPIMEEIKFVKEIKRLIITQKSSFLVEKHPEIIQYYDDIVGGKFTVDKYLGIQFIPIETGKAISLSESSSSVKSLVELNFYLRHCARENQILMIDEPEMNLHPENQRKLARLLAMLVNAGIKVLITTHSDYIIREFNMLMMLNDSSNNHRTAIAKEAGLGKKKGQLDCLLDYQQVRGYVLGNGQTLPMDINQKYGMDAKSFNTAIEEANALNNRIILGE